MVTALVIIGWAGCGDDDDDTSAAGEGGGPAAGGSGGEPDAGSGGSGGSAGGAGGTGGEAGAGGTGGEGGAAGEAGAGGEGGSAGESGTGGGGGETLFPNTNIWYRDRSNDPKHPDSDAVIAWMSQPGNSFEPNGEFRIDLSLTLLTADADAPFRTFQKNNSFYEGSCHYGRIPVPPSGSIEGEPDYHCAGDGDCHLLVHHPATHLLFELYRADIAGGAHDGDPFAGGCLIAWDLARDYGWNVAAGLDYDRMGVGVDCTSADAAGFPIAALLFTPEELDSGAVNHALRFILPNRNIRELIYVAPATHSTGATGGPATAPPYGAQLRLKKDADLTGAHPEVDLDALPRGARAVIKALQTHGMFLSDGGSIALTGGSDRHSAVKYCDHDRYEYCDEDPDRLLHEHDLKFLRITDFEMLDNGGPERTWQGDCTLLYEYDDATRTVVPN
jgi:serine/threonine-protein kinase